MIAILLYYYYYSYTFYFVVQQYRIFLFFIVITVFIRNIAISYFPLNHAALLCCFPTFLSLQEVNG